MNSNAIFIAYQSEFDKYLPTGYSVALANKAISIHVNGMEILKIDANTEFCKVCCVQHATKFSFFSDKSRILNLLTHVQKCLKQREAMNTLNKCTACVAGWRDGQDMAVDCEFAPTLTDGHIMSKYHAFKMQEKVAANAYNITKTLENEKNVLFIADARKFLDNTLEREEKVAMFVKASLGLLLSLPTFDQPKDDYARAIEHALGGLNAETIITVIKTLDKNYVEIGTKVYEGCYAPIQGEADMRPSAP